VLPLRSILVSMQARDSGDDDGRGADAGAGDASAFDRVYERHRGGALPVAALPRPRDSRGFFRTSGSSSVPPVQVDAAARFSTWLYAVARNRMIDHWRMSRGQRHVSLDDDGEGDAIGETLEDSNAAMNPQGAANALQECALLVAALEALPAAQRDAFLLHVEGGLAVGEIAALTAAPAETVKSRLRYAYRRLRAALGDPA
jgi:RNA polymerase sigma-70 factor (ECF subfamily)